MKTTLSILTLIASLALSACGSNQISTAIDLPTSIVSEAQPSQVVSEETAVSSAPIEIAYAEEDLFVATAVNTIIQLNGDSIVVEGDGVRIDSSIATITASGVYGISGSLADGQIRVDSNTDGNVTLLLDGVQIHNDDGPAIYVANANKVILTLVEGTQNDLNDGADYTGQDADGEPNAAIFSHDDLTINGTGELTVDARYNNGIASNDDLLIISGKITVNAVNDGIKGKDSVTLKDGIVTISAGADGIQSTNAVEVDKGVITLAGGLVKVTSGLDGVQSANDLILNGTDIKLTTGGGNSNSSLDGGGIWGGGGMEGNANKPADSAKGLKATNDLIINAGEIDINSADDAIHANENVTINGGSLLAGAGDDGIHADENLTINDGNVLISASYEALEGALITVEAGNISLTSLDDGFNVAGGADGSSVNGRPGQNAFDSNRANQLIINGGNIFVNAGGDGLDSNGTITINAGTVTVFGPSNNGNGALDAAGGMSINGGTLIAFGSSGMAELPGENSTQVSMLYNFEASLTAGTLIHLENASGKTLFTIETLKDFQSIVFSSPELKQGDNYNLYLSGSASGENVNGLYASDEVYTPGNLVETIMLSSISNSFGVAGGFSLGGGMGGGRNGGTRPSGTPPEGFSPPTQ